ncbi:MAG: hypothetical protein HY328_15765 [Chloroflexi bacterium]|nr:hypothetical protein [Chloroflexota bacterium]
MTDSSFRLSPARRPFQYHVWLELPFPLAVKVNERFFGNYKSFRTEISVVILSNVYKVVTGSFWQQGREVQEWAARIQAGKKEPPPRSGWIQEYVSGDKVHNFVRELEQREGTRYVHVEETPAVVHIVAPVPADLIPLENFYSYDLSPQMGFINEEILPELQRIIDAYRIAAYPGMRYAISPVSEALVDKALVHFTDRENIQIGNIHYGFDVKSPVGIGESPAVQERFDRFLRGISALQAENQLASAYYLYRMRRWTEAIALASAVVDSLMRELVFQTASSEFEAETIWSDNGSRYKELFNRVFPAFGKPKLSDINKPLWDDFVEAKKSRGSKVHGNHSIPFDKKQEKETKRYLTAFHDVAGWLLQQMDTDWALDCSDENGQRLEAFP